MELNSRKFALYIIAVLVLSASGILIYDGFGLSKHHTSKVIVFCDDIHENIGVTNTRSLDMLKDYSHNTVKFESRDAFKIRNFFADTIHVKKCTEGVLFSKRYNGARSVKIEIDGETEVVTVLTENITFLEEEE